MLIVFICTYIIIFLVSLLLTTLRENKREAVTFYLIMSKLLFFHFIVPCMIIKNLRRKIPLLFSDNNIEMVTFYWSGQSFTPRQQVFLPLKKSIPKGRWGSQHKFKTISYNNHSSLNKLLPVVEVDV